MIVTGSAVCTGDGVDSALVEQFVRRRLSAIPHGHERTRVELLQHVDLTIDGDYVAVTQDLS